jgi:hypothetical protein
MLCVFGVRWVAVSVSITLTRSTGLTLINRVKGEDGSRGVLVGAPPSGGMADDAGPVDERDGDSSGGTADDERPDEQGDRRDCPECGESLPVDARFCPHCSTALDEDGEVVDLSELDGDIVPDDPAALLTEDETGRRRATGPVRVLSGLAVSVPLAPLTLFLVGTLTSLSVWSGALVFLAGWFVPAAALTRARVPAEAFGYSLYLVAVATLLIPVAIEAGDQQSWAGALTVSFETVAAASLSIAAVLVVLGTFVIGTARKRVTGERRAFESAREDDGTNDRPR